MKISGIVAVAGLALSVACAGEAKAGEAFTGYRMLAACLEASEQKQTPMATICLGVTHAVATIRNDQKLICLPKDYRVIDGVKTVYAFMQKHSDLLKLDLVDIATSAFVEAIPCKKPPRDK